MKIDTDLQGVSFKLAPGLAEFVVFEFVEDLFWCQLRDVIFHYAIEIKDY